MQEKIKEIWADYVPDGYGDVLEAILSALQSKPVEINIGRDAPHNDFKDSREDWKEYAQKLELELREKTKPVDVEGLKKDEKDPTYTHGHYRFVVGWNDCIDHLHAKGYLNTPQWQDLKKLKHHEEIRLWRHNDVWGCKMIWKNGKYARTFHSVSSPQKAIRFALEIDTKQTEDTE